MKKDLYPLDPWEKQPKETDKQFEAFQIFRDMPQSTRTRTKVAEQLQKSIQLIYRWSKRNNWKERVQAWDRETDRKERQKRLDEIIKMRAKHADIAVVMLVKGLKALKEIPEDEIKVSDAIKMLETGAKLERISRGDVGEVVEERDGGKSLPVVRFYMPDNNRDKSNTEETGNESE